MMEQRVFNAETEALLLANDSSITRLKLFQKISTISWMETFQRFYRAIANNTVMNELTIDLQEIAHLTPGNGTDLLLQVIRESTCIRTIVLGNGFSRRHDFRTFISTLISIISKNKYIEACRFGMVLLYPQDLAFFLRKSSVTDLAFLHSEVDFSIIGENEYPNFKDNIKEVGDAFEKNETLKQLHFAWIPRIALNNRTILETARQNKSITNFSIHIAQGLDQQYNPQVLADVAMYLNASERDVVYLDNMNWDNTTFGAFAKQMHYEGFAMKCLKFNNCKFDKDASIVLKQFLLENRHIEAISFGGNKAAFHNETDVLGETIGNEKGPENLLLKDYAGLSSSINGLVSICNGLASKTCKLQTLSLPCLSPTQLDFLLHKVPTFKNVRYLRFILTSESEHMKRKLIAAFRNNRYFYRLRIDAPWITEKESKILDCFCYRNMTLSTVVTHFSKGRTPPLSTIPLFFQLSTIATSGIGPKDIVAMLSKLGDDICDPNRDHFLSSEKCKFLLAPFCYT